MKFALRELKYFLYYYTAFLWCEKKMEFPVVFKLEESLQNCSLDIEGITLTAKNLPFMADFLHPLKLSWQEKNTRRFLGVILDFRRALSEDLTI